MPYFRWVKTNSNIEYRSAVKLIMVMWCFRLTTVSTFVYDLKIMVTYPYPICSDLLRCSQRQPLKYFLVHIRMDSSEIGKLKYGMPNCIYKKGECFNEMLYLEAVLSPMAFLQKQRLTYTKSLQENCPPVATESPETNKQYQQPSIKEEPEKMPPEFAWGFQRCTENRRCSMAFLHSKKYAADGASDGRTKIDGVQKSFLLLGVQHEHSHHQSHPKYRLKWA